MPDPAIESAYRATDYRVDDPAGRFVIRVGEPSPEADRLLMLHQQSEWAFVTAYNPGSKPQPDEENARRMAELETVLRAGWPYYSGAGSAATARGRRSRASWSSDSPRRRP
jgi:hypothetical protein